MDNNSSQNKKYFEELAKKRASGLKDVHRPALKNVQIYFIYDLLQNADNAQATYAIFELYRDKLVFKHNGQKHFTISNPANEEDDLKNNKLGDVNAITSIANINQKEPKIGRIGFGIKSIYDYTSTLFIFDANFCFKIEKYVIPTLLTEDYEGRNSDETIFVIPVAFHTHSEIFKKLQNIDYPNLFLKTIASITYTIDSQFTCKIERNIELEINYADIKVEFTNYLCQKGDTLIHQRFWVFKRLVKEYPISIAFLVGEDGYLKPVSKTFAFCFFQTKESTNLNFMINAPFLMTVERTKIKPDEPHNQLMIKELAILSAKSLMIFKDIGQKYNVQLINDNFLYIVPVRSNMIVESKNQISFVPFVQEIKKVFLTEEIIPTENGFTSRKNAYWASDQKLLQLINNEQLTLLVNNPNAKWVLKSLDRNIWGANNGFICSIVQLVICDYTLFNAKIPDLKHLSGWVVGSPTIQYPDFKDCFDPASEVEDLNPFSSCEKPNASGMGFGCGSGWGSGWGSGTSNWGTNVGKTPETGQQNGWTASSKGWVTAQPYDWGTNGSQNWGTGQQSNWKTSSGNWGTGLQKTANNSASKNSNQNKSSFKGISVEFIEKQSFEWLNSFYKWINESKARIDMAKTIPIFLDKNKKAVSAFNPENKNLQLFFPVFTKAEQNYPTVNPDLFKNEENFVFMRKIGISVPSIVKNHIYDITLPNWKGDSQADFKKIIFYFQYCSLDEREPLIEKLKDTELLLFESKENKGIQKGKPETLYFPSQLLIEYFEPLPQTRFICIDNYKSMLGENKSEKVIQFFMSLGVRKSISVIEESASNEELNKYKVYFPSSTFGRICKEFRIEGFNEVFQAIQRDHSRSITLWNILLQFAKTKNLKQFYEGKSEFSSNKGESMMYHSTFRSRLINEKWLVTSKNEFVSPCEIFLVELPKEYSIDDPAISDLADFLKIKKRKVELLTSEYIEDHDFVERIKKAGLFEKFTRELKEAESKK